MKTLLRKVINEMITEVLDIIHPYKAVSRPFRHRMSREDTADMIDDLDNKLAAGIINFDQYNELTDEVLQGAGWSFKDYADAIDDRWDFANDPSRPANLRSRNN